MIASTALIPKPVHPGRKIVGVLPQLVEQPCVLNSEDTLLVEVASDLNPADAAGGAQTR
jgi:hypothetical protein